MRIIDSGRASAESLMKKDSFLLQNLQPREIILHLYEWELPQTITYGHFIKPENFLVLGEATSHVGMSKRPTGGGITFHHGDYAFSLLISSLHDAYSKDILSNYQTVNLFVVRLLNEVFAISGSLANDEMPSPHSVTENFCSAKLSKYDVVIHGKKVGGAAQRNMKQGLLHQGSIFLSGGSESMYRSILLPEVAEKVCAGMHQNAYFPLGMAATADMLAEARQKVKYQMIKQFSYGEL